MGYSDGIGKDTFNASINKNSDTEGVECFSSEANSKQKGLPGVFEFQVVFVEFY